jgi:ribosome biogenesis GTPase / thiamine phosphate phosphatase
MRGKVLKSTGSWYTVMDIDGKSYRCKIRGKLRLNSSRTTNPITVGDTVEIAVENDGVTGISIE